VAELDFTCEMDALGTPQLAGQYTGEVWLNGRAFDDRLAWVGVFALDAADHLTPDTMGYVTIATGSRPPGFTTVEFTAQQLSSFPGESMTSYEVGLKNEFFDHRLRLNVDGFYTDSLTPWLDGVAAPARRVSSVKIFLGSRIGRDQLGGRFK
jgi:hypothetical protein